MPKKLGVLAASIIIGGMLAILAAHSSGAQAQQERQCSQLPPVTVPQGAFDADCCPVECNRYTIIIPQTFVCTPAGPFVCNNRIGADAEITIEFSECRARRCAVTGRHKVRFKQATCFQT